MKRSIALGIAGTAVAVAAVGGVAYAADSSTPSGGTSATSSPSTGQPSTGAPAKGHRHRAGALGGRALHGQFTVERQGKPTVVDVQRGEVTKADASSITVRSTDGFEATYALTPQTKIRDKKAPATAGDLTAGKKVGVLADDDGGHPSARAIRVLPVR